MTRVAFAPMSSIGVPGGKLDQLAGGDTAAFEWLYKNYSRQIRRYVGLMTAHHPYSDDIVQEIFCKIWVKKEKLKTVADLNAWLFIVTRNYVVNWRQQQLREQTNENAYGQFYQLQNMHGMMQYEKEFETILAVAVRQLPPQRRLIFILQKEYNWQRGKVAKVLRLSPETIKTHMKIAMREIKLYCATYQHHT